MSCWNVEENLVGAWLECASDDSVEPVLCAFDSHQLLPIDVVSSCVVRTKVSPGEYLSPRSHIAFGSIDLVESSKEIVCTMGETKGIESRSRCLVGCGWVGGYWRLLYKRGV